MRRILSIILIALSLPAFGQKISLYKSPLDSVVKRMDALFAGRIFFVPDTTGNTKLTIQVDNPSLFVDEAVNVLKGEGYSVTMQDGNMFILKGVGISTKLPLQYFQESVAASNGSDEYLDALSEDVRIANFANKVYEIGREDNCKGGKLYLSGVVQNVRNGEPLVGVSVYSEEHKSYAQTDEFGFYKILLPAGANKIKASGFSLNDVELDIRLYETGSLDIIMKEKVFSLNEATVSAESSNTRRTNKMGVELVRIGRIKQVPTVMGEADVLKVLVTLPGVKSVGEASGGFNVRGGATDQNLILFNEGTIYNPTHLFGLFSAFNPDVVTDVELYKSSIPAEYGGRLSSVLEIRGREGNDKNVTGSLGIGLLTTKGHIEGPFTKSGKTKFIVGARTTYSDWMLGLLPESSGYNQGTANFYDVNASISHKFNEKNSIYAYGYYSRDKFSFSIDTTYMYHNINGSIKWRSNFSDQHSMIFTVGYDQYGYDVMDTHKDVEAYNLKFNIQQGFAKLKFKSVLNDRHTLNYGLNSIYYHLMPGMMLPYNIPGANLSLVKENILDTEEAVESAVYVSDTWNISDKVSADLGVRYSLFANLNPFKYYGGPEFRVSGKWLASDRVTIKAGFNSMRQYIHMLSNTTTMSPTDIWKLSDVDIKPQTGWQAAVALYSMHFNDKVEFSVEGYYKKMDNYLDYKSGSVLIMNSNLAQDVIATRGQAYGAEVMIKKPLGKLNGWISYTYSRTLLQEKADRGVFSVNGGDWYPAAYDKPHDVKFVGNYKFTHRYSLSLNVDYSTGRPVTVPVGKYLYGGGYRLYFSDRNAYRVPDYFRMDVAVNIEPSHYLKQLSHFSVTFGVYNVTGRKNAYSVYYDTNSGKSVQGYMLTIFGAPIPYVNINVKF